MRPLASDDHSLVSREHASGSSSSAVPLGAMIQEALHRHRRLAFIVFLAVLIPGTLYSLIAGRPAYVAEASIHIAPRFPKTLEEDDEVEGQTHDYRAFLQQQVYILTRYGVLENALERMGPERLLWQGEGEPVSRAAQRLSKAIEAVPVRDSFLINVALEGPEPEGLATIVNAVVASYMESQKDESFFQPEERINDLLEHRAEVEHQMAGLLAQKGELAVKLGVSQFDEGSPRPYQQLLDDTSVALSAARRSLLQARSFRQALDDENSLQLAVWGMSDGAGTPSENDVQLPGSLLARRESLATRLAGLTEAHPGYRAYKNQLAEAETELLAAARAGADARIQKAVRYTASLQKEFDDLRLRATSYVADHARGQRFERAIQDGQLRLSEIDSRIAFLDLESAGPGFARVFSPARTPDIPTRARRAKYFIVFLLFGLAAGLGAAMGAHARDRTIHSAADLERALGFPPIADIPDGDSDEASRDATDQLRRLALCIDRERRHNGTTTIVVTPASDDTGTSAIVTRLGSELTAMGRNVLTVDANVVRTCRNPASLGLVDVLKGGAVAEAAIVHGAPSQLPIGENVGYARLPYGHRLADMLGALAGAYDIVLVEAPPTLLSADAELLAEATQATLLVVAAETDTVDHVRCALGTLRAASPPLFGAVLRQGRSERYRPRVSPAVGRAAVSQGTYRAAHPRPAEWHASSPPGVFAPVGGYSNGNPPPSAPGPGHVTTPGHSPRGTPQWT